MSSGSVDLGQSFGEGGGTAGVSSLNGLTGALTLIPGTGIVITPSGSTIQISNTTSGGTVTSVSVVTANGFSGTVATASSTPAITLHTTITGILQGNGSAISAATTTGSGSVVLATSPTLITPNLDTPSLLVLTNATGLPLTTGVTGLLPIANGGTGAATTSQNFAFIGPTSGSGAPSFRAIVAGDIPTLNQNTTGTAANITASSNSTLTSLPNLATVGTITSGIWNGTTIAIAHGGTGQVTAAAAFNALSPMTLTGDIIYEVSNGVAARLPIGTTNQVLSVVGGVPAWVNGGSGSGSVTSVGLIDGSVTPIYQISGSPVTTSGTLDFTLYSQSGNLVFAGPTSAGSAQPTFRALVGADLPNPSPSTLGGIESYAAVTHQWINQISTLGVPSSTQPAFSDISGQVSLTTQVTGILPIANGGSGLASTSQSFVFVGPTSGSGAPSFRLLVNGDLPFLATTYLPLAGGTMSGTINMNSNAIINLTTPVNPNDAATKSYVDTSIANLGVSKDAAVYATATALPTNVYNNGASGVGATLTGVSVGALSVDGNTVTTGQRLLIKNEVTTANNGIYVVTTVGSGIAVYVLTRSSDFNQTADINTGDSVFVTSGATLASTTWVLNSATPVVVGTDPITWVQTSGPGTITAGTGIAVTGTVVSLAPIPTLTLLGNNTGGTATPTPLTVSQVNAMLGTLSVIGTIDGNGAAANGLSISGTSLFAQSASATVPGMVNLTTQSFAGNKTFTGTVAITPSSTSALVINTTSFIFDSVNNALGIGLQPSTSSAIDIINSSATSKPIQITSYGTGSTNVFRGRFARGTSGSPTAAQNTDLLSVFSGRGYGTSQFAAASTGVINVVAGETFTNTSNLTYLQFMTTPTGSVTAVETFRIASTGTTIGPQSASTAIHQINGGVNYTRRTITANLTVDTTTTDYIILCNNSGAISITLPAPSDGRVLVIKDINGNANTNNISILQHAAEKIEGIAATKVLATNWGSFTLTSDGTDWFLI